VQDCCFFCGVGYGDFNLVAYEWCGVAVAKNAAGCADVGIGVFGYNRVCTAYAFCDYSAD
jgi:hypothetical protein